MRLPNGCKYSLRKWVVDGPFHGVGAPLYDLLIRTQLAVEWVRDGQVERSPAGATGMDSGITAVIKTFERPDVLRRLVASIRRIAPRLEIIVVDDSLDPVPIPIPGVKTVLLPYDQGVSAGRIAGLEHVETRYFLLLDDDFVFFRHTLCGPAVQWMDTHPEVDIMGGAVVDLPFYTVHDYLASGGLYETDARSVRPVGSKVGGLVVHDKVANFFVGRTETVRKVSWDPLLKILDHADFFTRARGKLLTVYNPQLKILHARTLFDARYMQRREDLGRELRALDERYGRPRPS